MLQDVLQAIHLEEEVEGVRECLVFEALEGSHQTEKSLLSMG